MRKLRIFLILFVVLICTWLGFFIFNLIYPATLEPLGLTAKLLERYSVKLGLILKEIKIPEYNQTYCVDIRSNKELDLNSILGTSIFLVPKKDIEREIKSIDCFSGVRLRTILPHTLEINLSVKKPIAIWQNNKQFVFLDEDEKPIKIRSLQGLERFIVVTGDTAPGKVRLILDVLKSNQELYKKVAALIRIGDRRWNVRFDNDTEILLPSENPEIGWERFIKIYNQNADFKNWKYKKVDLRIQNRIYAN